MTNEVNGEMGGLGGAAAPQSTEGNGRAVPLGDGKSGDILGNQGLLRNAVLCDVETEAADIYGAPHFPPAH